MNKKAECGKLLSILSGNCVFEVLPASVRDKTLATLTSQRSCCSLTASHHDILITCFDTYLRSHVIGGIYCAV